MHAEPGQLLFINSEILGNHSLGIDTKFATMSDPQTQELLILVQSNGPPLTAIESKML